MQIDPVQIMLGALNFITIMVLFQGREMHNIFFLKKNLIYLSGWVSPLFSYFPISFLFCMWGQIIAKSYSLAWNMSTISSKIFTILGIGASVVLNLLLMEKDLFGGIFLIFLFIVVYNFLNNFYRLGLLHCNFGNAF